LAPVSVVLSVAVPSVNPAVRDPALVRLWRHFPPSLVPSVSVAIPTMVPGNPHMVTAGSPTGPLDMNPGWRYANHNLGRRGAQGQRAYKNQSQQSFKNHTNISSSPYTAIPTAVQTFQRAPAGCMGRKGGPNRSTFLQACGGPSWRGQKRRVHWRERVHPHGHSHEHAHATGNILRWSLGATTAFVVVG